MTKIVKTEEPEELQGVWERDLFQGMKSAYSPQIVRKLKPYFAPVIEAEFEVVEEQSNKENQEKKHLVGRVQKAINAYESATTPKQRYKAESELCRLMDRQGGFFGDSIIYRGEKAYLTSCERYGDYRIPRLRVAAINKTPQTQLLTPDECLKHPLWKEFFPASPRQYAEVLGKIEPRSFYFEERARGARRDKK